MDNRVGLERRHRLDEPTTRQAVTRQDSHVVRGWIMADSFRSRASQHGHSVSGSLCGSNDGAPNKAGSARDYDPHVIMTSHSAFMVRPTDLASRSQAVKSSIS